MVEPPTWTICSSNWIISPKIRVKKNMFETTTQKKRQANPFQQPLSTNRHLWQLSTNRSLIHDLFARRGQFYTAWYSPHIYMSKYVHAFMALIYVYNYKSINKHLRYVNMLPVLCWFKGPCKSDAAALVQQTKRTIQSSTTSKHMMLP